MFSDEPTVDLDKDHDIIALLAERRSRSISSMVSLDQLSRALLQRSRLPTP
jgi:hypothetical protein